MEEEFDSGVTVDTSEIERLLVEISEKLDRLEVFDQKLTTLLGYVEHLTGAAYFYVTVWGPLVAICFCAWWFARQFIDRYY